MAAKRILIDPGHGGNDSGAVGNGIKEKDINIAVCRLLPDLLKPRGIEAILTRTGDVSMSLSARTDMAVAKKVDAVLSRHSNAGGGKGTETYRSVFNAESGRLAVAVHEQLIAAFPEFANRGIKTRLYPGRSDWDYYHMIREPHRQAGIPAIITENGFIDHVGDAAVLKRADFAAREAEALARGICTFFGVPWELNLTPILGPPQATVTQAQEWARQNNAHQRFIDIAQAYWHYGQLTGIRPEVLYAQSAKETAFGRYGGAVTPDQNNWAGIKIKNPIGDRREDHEAFATPEDGVRGHFNHICAYVGYEPIGRPHPRYEVVKSMPWAGTVRYVEELGGKWAPSPSYGERIVKLLNSLLAAQVPDEPELPSPDELIKKLEAENAALKAENAALMNENVALMVENVALKDKIENARKALS